MRNPNGYGSVYKLSGKRRRPFIVAKTVSLKGGRQKRIILGYYETRKEANLALADYNKNPFDLNAAKITFYEVFEKMLLQNDKVLNPATIKLKKSLIKTFEPIYNVPIRDLKLINLQDLFDADETSYATNRQKKSLCTQIYTFALKRELVEKNYAELIDINKRNEKVVKRMIFSNEEIEKLWDLSKRGNSDADIVLIMIFTGMRIGELLDLKIADINIEQRYCKAGSKTTAGKDRLIPFNNKIFTVVEKYIDNNKIYLFQTLRGKKLQYNNWRTLNFSPLMENIAAKHTVHDCRHTFATLLNNADANQTATKDLMGHTNFTTTEKFYTHKDIKELHKAVDKLI